MTVGGVVTQARRGESNTVQHVETLTVKVSTDNSHWQDVDCGATFNANYVGASTEMKQEIKFAAPARARYVRLVVQSYHNYISMRAGVVLAGGRTVHVPRDYFIGNAFVDECPDQANARSDRCCYEDSGDAGRDLRVKLCARYPHWAELLHPHAVLVHHTPESLSNVTLAFFPCPCRGCCEVNNMTGTVSCTPGNMGALCAVCAAEYYKRSDEGRCVACADANLKQDVPWAPIAAFVGFALLFMATDARSHWHFLRFAQRHVQGCRRHLMGKSKVVLSFFQIMMLSKTVYRVPFPSIFIDFLDKFEFLRFELFKLAEHWYWEVIECFRKLILTGIALFFGTQGSLLQTAMSMVLVVIYIPVLQTMQPYKDTLGYFLICVAVGVFTAWSVSLWSDIRVFNARQSFRHKADGTLLALPRLRPPVELYHVFISHSQQDGGDQVAHIKKELEKYVETMVVFTDIAAGRAEHALAAKSQLSRAIEQSTVFLVFLTKSYFTRKWCVKEFQEASARGKHIVFVQETDPRHGGMSIDTLIRHSTGQQARAAADAKSHTSNLWNQAAVGDTECAKLCEWVVSHVARATKDGGFARLTIGAFKHESVTGNALDVPERTYGVIPWYRYAEEKKIALQLMVEQMLHAPAWQLVHDAQYQTDIRTAIEAGLDIIFVHDTGLSFATTQAVLWDQADQPSATLAAVHLTRLFDPIAVYCQASLLSAGTVTGDAAQLSLFDRCTLSQIARKLDAILQAQRVARWARNLSCTRARSWALRCKLRHARVEESETTDLDDTWFHAKLVHSKSSFWFGSNPLGEDGRQANSAMARPAVEVVGAAGAQQDPFDRVMSANPLGLDASTLRLASSNDVTAGGGPPMPGAVGAGTNNPIHRAGLKEVEEQGGEWANTSACTDHRQ
eukprot:g4033.t1